MPDIPAGAARIRAVTRAGSRPISGATARRKPPAAVPNVRHHGLIYGYDRYLRRFSRAGYDIGLAPLPDDVFHRSKSNNKFREYGASRVAGIYSHNDAYSNCVEHEVSGLLVSNDAGHWYDALERLIEDEALRLAFSNGPGSTCTSTTPRRNLSSFSWNNSGKC